MTGYGQAKRTFKDKTLSVEIRSLNSKFKDFRFKLPQNYRSKEQDIRKMITERIERGKIEVTVDVSSDYGDENYSINKALFTKYYNELQELSSSLNLNGGDIIQSIMRLPNVVATADNDFADEEWEELKATVADAITNFEAFRTEEGKALEDDLRNRIANITRHLKELAPFEKERIPKVRQRMQQNLDEFLGRDNVDKNRFEQEVLFYLEKIDINEEKVRLEQHCKYFLEELDKTASTKGRKLNFIGQEMGREINTLGSKAYSSDIQRFVVMMKDELEKIKEQVANSV